jgi:hypothetical protein
MWMGLLHRRPRSIFHGTSISSVLLRVPLTLTRRRARNALHPLAARIIASMPARIGSGSVGQASMSKAKAGSVGQDSAASAPPSAENAVLAGISARVRIPPSPLLSVSWWPSERSYQPSRRTAAVQGAEAAAVTSLNANHTRASAPKHAKEMRQPRNWAGPQPRLPR